MKTPLTIVVVIPADSSAFAESPVYKSAEPPPARIEPFSPEGCSSSLPAEARINPLKARLDLWKRLAI